MCSSDLIDGIENEALLYLLDEAGICASAASACAAGAMEPSHVLAAMGVGRSRALGALRLSAVCQQLEHADAATARPLLDVFREELDAIRPILERERDQA